MSEPNMGDTTNGGNPAASPTANTELLNKEKELDQRIVEKQNQLNQLSEVAKTLTQSVRDARDTLRELKETPPPPATDTFSADADDVPGLVKREVSKALEETKTQTRKANIESAYNIFKSKHPEFDKDSDVGFLNYQKFKEVADSMFLGDTVDQILSKYEFIRKGLETNDASNQARQGNVEHDSGIGDTTRVTNDSKPQANAMTRSLNEYEKEMAKVYPGNKDKGYPAGEQGYRMKLAEREQPKKS